MLTTTEVFVKTQLQTVYIVVWRDKNNVSQMVRECAFCVCVPMCVQGQCVCVCVCVYNNVCVFKTFRLLQHSLYQSVFLCSDFQEIANIGITKANSVQQNEGLIY